MSEPRCAERVHDGGRWPSFHQCKHKAVNQEGGKGWCKQHTPSLVKAKQDAARAAMDVEWAVKNQEWERAAKQKALEQRVLTLARQWTAEPFSTWPLRDTVILRSLREAAEALEAFHGE